MMLFLMTLNNLQGHLPIASHFRCNVSYSFEAVDNISTEIALCAVPRW